MKVVIASGLVLGVVTASPATPEDAPSEAAAAIDAAPADDIVVTAQRRVTDLQKTPIAISVFSDQTLRDRDIRDIRDIAGQVPNLYVPRASISHTTQTFALRGIGESDPIQEPALAIYVDDVYVPRQIGSMIEFNDLERVELLRGPQGTLYGRNSSAGALRIITRDPDRTTRVSGQIGYGTKNEVDVRAVASGPLSSTLAASLSYIHHTRDGFTYDPTLGHDVNRIDLDSFRAKLRWTPNDRLDILATGSLLRDRSDTRSYIPVGQPNGFSGRLSYSEVEPTQHLDGWSASLRAKYALADHLDVKYIASGSGFDLDPVYYDNDGQAALVQKNLIHYNDRAITQELQLTADLGALQATGGIFYLHERFFTERDGFTRLGTSPTAAVSGLRAHNITRTDAYAVYGEATYRFGPIFSLTGGLRGTIERKCFDFDNKVVNLARQPTAQSIAGTADDIWRALTPKASIEAQWTPALLQYASFSRGFKSGGYDNRATRLDLATLPFDPETVSTYETGLKAIAFDRALRANIAVFYNDYEDLQVSFFDPAYANSRRGNAGKAHSWGVELEANATLSPRLSLQAAAGYLRAEYDEYAGAGGAGVNADGNDLTNSPRWTLSGGTTYDVSLAGAGSLRFGLNGQYQSRIFSGALNRVQERVPGQLFVDGTVTWTLLDSRFRVALSGKNLLGSAKRVSSTYNPSIGVWYLNYPDPRTVLASLRFAL